ncbi:MAG: hypothetical protein ACPMAQ_08340 [Phycisphaerae bacterium]
MPVRTDPGEPKVIVVAGDAAQRAAVICRALGAAGIEVIRLPDVYAAMGELAADGIGITKAAVVQAGCIESTEVEFFPLANRLAPGGAYVFADGDGEEATLRAALAAGAKKLDWTDLAEWAEALADLPLGPTPDNVAEPPAPTAPEPPAPSAPEPSASQPHTDEPAPTTPMEPAPAATLAGDEPTDPAPQTPVEDHEPAAEAPAAESKPAPTPDIRVARPIAIPVEWRRPPSPNNGDDRSEDDSPAPAVPWRPQANRPARTPPSARAISPPTSRHPDGGVELTREEIDALLDRPTDGPESGRPQR